MNIVNVIPLKKGIGVEELSYFTAETIPGGAIVSVPLRGRKISAIVISCVDARTERQKVRSADFALKKLESVNAETGVGPAFMGAAQAIARESGMPISSVLGALLPLPLLSSLSDLHVALSRESPPPQYPERYIVQAEDDDRYTIYKSLIREMFAKGRSVFVALPAVQDIDHTYEMMEKGIKEYTYVLHGGIPPKELRKRIVLAGKNTHPVLIIGTAYYLGIQRSDIATIVLDKESSSAYRIQGRPFTDLRRFSEEFARRSGARLILGDIMLRVETQHRAEHGEFEALTRPRTRLVAAATASVVDMKATGEQPATGRFAIFSPTLVDMITEARKSGGQTFLLGTRKGYAPMTVCGDCGQVLLCPSCSAPVVLYKRKAQETDQTYTTKEDEERASQRAHLFVCHRCGHERAPEFTCSNCKSWRLVSLGIGIDQAEEALRGRFPDMVLFRLDRDSTPSHKEARKIVDAFYSTPGAVMIGTEMALPYLTRPISVVAVLSVNSLLTIPDFRMGERVFRLLLSLRARAERRFIIQTRDKTDPLFQLAAAGNIGEFTEGELAARKALGYPPFAILIKLTYVGKKEDGERVMKDIEQTFAPFTPVTFPSFIARIKGAYRMNALIKVPVGKWPNDEILGLLAALPQEVEVRVDPESVI